MKATLRKTIESLSAGDLVCVSWCDASVGKSSGSGMAIDVPVKSWGIFVGLIGDKVKHIVLAQNSFRYSDGLFDLDYTAVPLLSVDVAVLVKSIFPKTPSVTIGEQFMVGGHPRLEVRTFQRGCFSRG